MSSNLAARLRLVSMVAAASQLAGVPAINARSRDLASEKALEARCAAYAGRTFEGATITSAKVVPPTSNGAHGSCLLRGEMPKDLDFEVLMPLDWNKRTLFMGQGSFAGGLKLSDEFKPDGSRPGGDYAVIHTNHGHYSQSLNAAFALDQQQFDDFAYLAVPRVMASAKAVLDSWYGAGASSGKTVFQGCSGGGRQALLQAQRYPHLFDGIVARAPANAWVPEFMWYDRLAKQRAKPGAAISTSQAFAIAAAVEKKCDALDGLKDRILARPDLCKFDPAELMCRPGSASSCLTPVQVETARVYYSPTNVGNGRFIWPGFPPGEESGLGPFIASIQDKLSDSFNRYMVMQDPAADPRQMDPDKYIARLGQLSTALDAVDPDLRRFKAHGGKMLLWTGLSDWMITAENATGYYRAVVEKTGGQAVADDFIEYYTSPSVGHCSGGAGADQFDLLEPMFAWLEKGVKPSSRTIVATKASAGGKTTVLSRPLCRYPRYTKYNGGDPSKAASFTCEMP